MPKATQKLEFPYFCGLLTIKKLTIEKGSCSLEELKCALEGVSSSARLPGYSHKMVDRMVERGFIAKAADGALVYLNTPQNNDILNENIRLLRYLNSLVE